MHVEAYLEQLRERERELADVLVALGECHAGEPDVASTCLLLASWSEGHVKALDRLGQRQVGGAALESAPALLPALHEMHRGTRGLLLDLHELWLLAQGVHLRWTVLGQAARVLRDRELEAACAAMGEEVDRVVAWLHTRIVEAAPQALIAAP